MKVSEIMSGRVVTIGQREPVIAAARLLKRMNLGALPVTDDKGKLKGMLTDRDAGDRRDNDAGRGDGGSGAGGLGGCAADAR